MILVLCAVLQELHDFSHADVDVVAVGVGPVEAAIGTTRAVLAKPYQCAINVGIAGGFRGRSAVGDAVAVTREHFVDLGLEGGGELTLPGGVRLIDTCTSDEGLLAPYRTGVLTTPLVSGVTSATITTSDARAALLDASLAPGCESMEGFAVLRALGAANVPGLELRGISNLVGDREKSAWNFRAGSAAAIHALTAFLDAITVRA